MSEFVIIENDKVKKSDVLYFPVHNSFFVTKDGNPVIYNKFVDNPDFFVIRGLEPITGLKLMEALDILHKKALHRTIYTEIEYKIYTVKNGKEILTGMIFPKLFDSKYFKVNGKEEK